MTEIDEIRRLLLEFYTPEDEDALKWLDAPHPQLEGKRAADVIAAGRASEVLAILHRLDSGAYL